MVYSSFDPRDSQSRKVRLSTYFPFSAKPLKWFFQRLPFPHKCLLPHPHLSLSKCLCFLHHRIKKKKKSLDLNTLIFSLLWYMYFHPNPDLIFPTPSMEKSLLWLKLFLPPLSFLIFSSHSYLFFPVSSLPLFLLA